MIIETIAAPAARRTDQSLVLPQAKCGRTDAKNPGCFSDREVLGRKCRFGVLSKRLRHQGRAISRSIDFNYA